MDETLLREELVRLLRGDKAHMPFADAVKDFPEEHINDFPPNVSYSFWHIIEHIRITQWDIIDFMLNPKYEEPKWPDDYWPKKEKMATKLLFAKSVARVEKDLQKLIEFVSDPTTDLNKPGVNGGGTVLREALLVADHNAYHTGEFAILRQVIRLWGKDHTK